MPIIPQLVGADEIQVIKEHQKVEVCMQATPFKVGTFQVTYDKHEAQSQNCLIKNARSFLRRELANNMVDRRDS